MSEPSGEQGKPGDSWERRAADLANDVQRWLIKSSARSMRDELGDQVKKALRGSGGSGNSEEGSENHIRRAATLSPDVSDLTADKFSNEARKEHDEERASELFDIEAMDLKEVGRHPRQ